MPTAVGQPPDIVIPPNSPLVPKWAYDAVRLLNAIKNATCNNTPFFSFGSTNAVVLPSNFTGTIALSKLTTSGSFGSIKLQNGVVTDYQAPS